VTLNPHPESDQHQNVTTSTWSCTLWRSIQCHVRYLLGLVDVHPRTRSSVSLSRRQTDTQSDRHCGDHNRRAW